MTISIILGLLAFPVLLLGASMAVKHSKVIALHLGISEFYIGLTILSIGTSIPEIFTHIVSATRILTDPGDALRLAGIAIGTDLGSNIIQITAITGLIGLLGNITVQKAFLWRDYLFMLLGIIVVWVFCATHEYLSRIEGFILMASYFLYLYYLTCQEDVTQKIVIHNNYHPLRSIILIGAGLLLVLVAAEVILDSADIASKTFGVEGSLIGALVIGVVTALPELTTALAGIRQKANGISIGTLVGSNITNPLLGIGLGGLISGYPVEKNILRIDLPFWLIASLLVWLFLFSGKRITTWEAIVIIATYPAYILLRIA